MKRDVKVVLYLLCFSLWLSGCSDSFLENDTAPPEESIEFPPLTIEEIESEFAKLTIETGINDFSIRIANNRRWSFRIIAPEVSENESLPLFVNLHGGALTPRTDAHQGTACLIEPALKDTKAYILSPNSNGLLWYDATNQWQVVNLVEFTLKYLSIDPERVVVTGYSDGGNGSWFLSDEYPELFSAGIPMATAYGLSYENGILQPTQIPLYAIQGELDELFPFTNTESYVELSVAAGSDITLVKAVGLTHGEPCNYLSYLIDAIAWLKTTVWN